MTKVEREVVFNSENGQKEMTGVRHSDDDVKKKVIDCVFKLGQLNNIPEKYVEKNSDCSRSSVGRVYRCNFDGRSPIPNWTTIFNFFSWCDWKGNDYCQYSGGVVLDSEAFSRRFCGCRLYS